MATILKDYQPLKNFVGSIIHPQEVKREYSVSGYLFVLSQNLRENYLDFSDKFYISDNIAKQISKNLLDEGDIVTVRTGSIGLSAVVSGFKEKIYASADVIVIKNPKISSFYVSTFLNSKFGKLYLNRIIYGALQPHITPKLLGEIPIPLPDEASIEKIHRLVGTALDNFRQSETLYFRA
ncbi:restriction endonuclease subunit S [Peptococcaceae bacterium]|nr:restriction endonuclease subunit S [Peptococcaceae bacterium]